MRRARSPRKSSARELGGAGGPALGTERTQSEEHSAAVGVWLPLISLIFGFAFAYICFVLFLQTPSVGRGPLAVTGILLLITSAASYVVWRQWLLQGGERGARLEKKVLLSLVLPALFLPSLYHAPAFPVSPLLRPWTQVSVVLQSVPLAEPPAPLPRDAIRLALDGQQVLYRDGLNPNAKWQPSSDQTGDQSSGFAEYWWRGDWAGSASASNTLSIIPPTVDGQLYVTWDNGVTRLALRKEGSNPIELHKIFPPPWGYNLAFLISIYVVVAWFLALVTTRFHRQLAHLPRVVRRRRGLVLIVGTLIGLSIITVWLQVQHLPDGIRSLTDLQLPRHNAVMSGHALDPWQYRLLSEIVAELLIRMLQLFSIDQPYVSGFLFLRLLQNVALFSLAFALYQKLTGSKVLGLLGILVMASSMTRVFYDSDLSFNTYFDVIFYLMAALLLLSDNFIGTAMVVPFAAINRETSALMPLMMFATLAARGKWRWSNLASTVAAAFAFLLVFVGLRLALPTRPLFVPNGQQLGLPLLVFNLARGTTWSGLFATLGAVPAIGLLYLRSWTRLWRAFLVVVCPVWFLAHFLGGVAAETRLFLVPQAIIFVPGVLFCVGAIAAASRNAVPANASLRQSV